MTTPTTDDFNSTFFEQSTDDCSMDRICQRIKRLLHGLKYYHTFCGINNKIDEEQLIKFCQLTYKSLLDDYIHTINEHDHILEDIKNYAINECALGNCNAIKCNLLTRHHRNRNINNEKNNNGLEYQHQVEFYRDLFESCHCYFLHSFDIGLRITQKQKQEISTDTSNNPCFDSSFHTVKKIINIKKIAFNEQDKFSRFENNKFSIVCNTDRNDEKNSETETTFMDELVDYVSVTGIVNECLQFKSFLCEEEYDTDAVTYDIDGDNMASNIFSIMKKTQHYKLVQQYTADMQTCTNSFSIGYIFYYWDYYKTKTARDEHYKNRNDHSGFSPEELYVEIKYKSLKEEILHNALHTLNITEFQIAVTKVDEYIKSERAKSTSVQHHWDKELHYGISLGTDLTYWHLLSVVLYCDWTKLCYKFSSTFRKIKPFETILQIKRRNREFANWSRLLRETVQYFGASGHTTYDDKLQKFEIHKVSGPFFCGMSFTMAMPEYNIRLCGPTSTSKKIEVATRFAGDIGIIIQLNNDGYYMSHLIRCFRCDWLSNYNGEDECLFFGGDRRVKIASIRNIATCNNFGIFIIPLFYFDCMLNGTDMDTDLMPKINNKHYIILNNLIQHKLEKKRNLYPDYINKTFDAFCSHKVQIVINFRFMDLFFSKIAKLVLYKLSRTYDYNETQKDKQSSDNFFIDMVAIRSKINKLNVFREDVLFPLFRNVNKIVIYTTNINGQKKYKIDLLSLLSILNTQMFYVRNDLIITIKATRKYQFLHQNCRSEPSWLDIYWKRTETKALKISTKWHASLTECRDGSAYSLEQTCLTIKKHIS